VEEEREGVEGVEEVEVIEGGVVLMSEDVGVGVVLMTMAGGVARYPRVSRPVAAPPSRRPSGRARGSSVEPASAELVAMAASCRPGGSWTWAVDLL